MSQSARRLLIPAASVCLCFAAAMLTKCSEDACAAHMNEARAHLEAVEARYAELLKQARALRDELASLRSR